MEHRPVLVAEVLGLLAGMDVRLFLDATLGLGGHTRAVLEAHPEARAIGTDRDAEMLKAARERLREMEGRVETHHAAFSGLGALLDRLG